MSASLAEARTPSQLARRQRIVTSAQQLLLEREYEQIQVREVAEHAGVALGTLYRYFPSKELLYAHALLAWADAFEAKVQPRGQGPAGDAERLRAALRAAARAYERAPGFFRLLTVLEATTEPEVREVFATFSDRFVAALRDAVRDLDPDDASSVAFLSASVLGSSLRRWALHGEPLRSVYDRIDATVDLVFGSPRPR